MLVNICLPSSLARCEKQLTCQREKIHGELVNLFSFNEKKSPHMFFYCTADYLDKIWWASHAPNWSTDRGKRCNAMNESLYYHCRHLGIDLNIRNGRWAGLGNLRRQDRIPLASYYHGKREECCLSVLHQLAEMAPQQLRAIAKISFNIQSRSSMYERARNVWETFGGGVWVNEPWA